MRSRAAYLQGPWRGETFLTSTAARSARVYTCLRTFTIPSPSLLARDFQKWKTQLKEPIDYELYTIDSNDNNPQEISSISIMIYCYIILLYNCYINFTQRAQEGQKNVYSNRCMYGNISLRKIRFNNIQEIKINVYFKNINKIKINVKILF